MSKAEVNALVRLTQDVPSVWLGRGDIGVVKSVWLSPVDCYEVEFSKPGQCAVRALLDAGVLEAVEPTPATATLE